MSNAISSKAAIIRQHGGAEVLKLEGRELPAPAVGEIQIENHAIGLNFIDTYFRTGLYKLDLPTVLGQEGAGVVTAVGPDVTEFSIGDRVAYYGPTGAYAQHRNLPVTSALPVPEDVALDTAAAITLKGMTVCYLLTMTWPLKKGETLLFHAASGGVGQIAVQWAKHIGATVIGTVGSAQKAELAKANGADHVINLREENFADRVLEITEGKGVDVVYDSIGKDSFADSLKCLRPRGLMVSFGNSSGPVSIPDLGMLTAKGLYVTRPSLFPYFNDREVMLGAARQVFDLVAKGILDITIGQRYPLSQIGDAHTALETRQTIGATIIEPR